MSRTSAFVGSPPANDRDLQTVSWYLHLFGLMTTDPHRGIQFVAKAPPGTTVSGPTKLIVSSVVAFSLTIAAIILVTGGRLYLRATHPKLAWGWDDWTIIPAALLGVAYFTLICLKSSRYGDGHHVWEVTYEQMRLSFLCGISASYCWFIGICFVKTSIALFQLRLVKNVYRGWRWYLTGCVVIFPLGGLVSFFVQFFYCTPVRATWDVAYAASMSKPMTCLKTPGLTMGMNVAHMLTDLMLLPVPVFFLHKKRIPLAKRIRLSGVILLGILSIASNLVRIHILEYRTVSLDLSYKLRNIGLWTIPDFGLGIVIASLPIFNVIFKEKSPKKTHSAQESSSLNLTSSDMSERDHNNRSFKGVEEPNVDINARDVAPQV